LGERNHVVLVAAGAMQQEKRSGSLVLPGNEPMDEAKIVRAHAATSKARQPKVKGRGQSHALR
jgi:hypothetical protein